MATVILTKAKNYSKAEIRKTVARALNTLDYDLTNKIDTIVIKPNLCYYWDYSTGETTDPRVVSAVIDWVRQKMARDIQIFVGEADASAMRTRYAFKILGYEKLSREKNVELVNLSEGEIVEREVVLAGEKLVLPVNKMILDTDLLINVPKLKYHRVVGFTCALKNIFGAIAKPKKYVYHKKLAHAIVGMNKIVRTNIVLVDGIVACGKNPRKLGAIMASDDAVACDFIAAKSIGCEPRRIGYFKLALREKIGSIKNLDLVENPVRLADLQMEFPRQNYLLQKWLWKLQLTFLRTYVRLAGDVLPPILREDNM